MSSERHARAKDVFLRAVELAESEREAFVARACGGDAELARAVLDMLRADAGGGAAIDAAEGMIAAAAEQVHDGRAATRHAERIGPYAVVRSLGAGGMGVVYEAEQPSPRRRVAVKVLRLGLDSERARVRFDLEGSLLGRLRHPGIAQIFEAGTSGGCPYFAMELVEGQPLDVFAASAGLDAGERLELVARVADAVEHAHQRGVIHRDLKPGNILVDGSGQPKILDFGVARVLDEGARSRLMTRSGEIVGTLAYMSPEQASGDPAEVDTRSDVYSLGVMLYELLAGRHPLDLKGSSLTEILRTIREVDPPALGRLRPELRGDVETIAAAALEKDKELRYGSAAALAADIRRSLRHEPITQRPTGRARRVRKFVRRHRSMVGALAATALVLVAGIVATSWQAWRKTVAEHEARTRQQEAEAARDESRRRLRLARAINDYVLHTMLESPDPFRDGADVKVREVLDRAAAGVDESFAGEPEVAAAVRDTLAMSFKQIGLPEKALALARRSWESRRRERGESDRDSLESLAHLAEILGSRNDPEALALTRKAHDLQLELLGADDPARLASLNNLAVLTFQSGDRAGGMDLMRRAVEGRTRVLGPAHRKTLLSRHTRAVMLNITGDPAGAEAAVREVIELGSSHLGRDHAVTLTARSTLASMLDQQGRLEDAEPVFRELLEAKRRVFGKDHAATGQALGLLAQVVARRGRPDEAEPLFREGTAIVRRALGDAHRATVDAVKFFVRFLIDRGRSEEAERVTLTLLARLREQLGDDDLMVVEGLNLQAQVRFAAGDLEGAEATIRAVIGILRGYGEAAVVKLARNVGNLAILLRRRGDGPGAVEAAREALALQRRINGDRHPDTALELYSVGAAHLLAGDAAAAEATLREALAIQLDLLPDGAADTLVTRRELGRALSALGRHADAEKELLAVARDEGGGAGARARRATAEALVGLYEAWERPDEAAAWRRRLAR